MKSSEQRPKGDRVLSALTIFSLLMLILVMFASLACSRGRRSSPTAPPQAQAAADVEVRIETKTNGEDADAPPGPSVTAGRNVRWTYRIRNVGAAPLSSIALSDDMRGDIACPADTLQPGESMTCSDTDVAAEGQYANIATVNATADSIEVTDSDPSHYYGTPGGNGGVGAGGGNGGGSQNPPSNEPGGCGPGFWKNNADKNGANAWPAGYFPSTTLAAAGFVNTEGIDPTSYSLRNALEFSGGPTLEDAERNMVKHAVAALLNAATPGVNYPWSEGQVLGEANDALATNNRQALNVQKDEFEAMNSQGCPLE